MSIFRRSRFSPTKQLSRRRRLVNLTRNVWILRGELWKILRRKQEEREPPITLRCVACRHELTKPCIRGRVKHVVKWPEGAPGFETGQLVEIARQKPRGGSFEKDYDLTAMTP